MDFELQCIPDSSVVIDRKELDALLVLANTMVDDYDFWREDGHYPEVESAIDLTKAIRNHPYGK